MIYSCESCERVSVVPSSSLSVKSPQALLGEKLDSPKEPLCIGTGATLICLWHALIEWQVQDAAQKVSVPLWLTDVTNCRAISRD